MPDKATTCITLIHDVVEDTDMTFNQLQAEGSTSEILAAINLMTLDESVPYI